MNCPTLLPTRAQRVSILLAIPKVSYFWFLLRSLCVSYFLGVVLVTIVDTLNIGRLRPLLLAIGLPFFRLFFKNEIYCPQPKLRGYRTSRHT